MSFRKFLFWSHLVAGVGVGLFVFVMSATGVLLMYEHAVINWVASGVSVPHEEGQKPLSVDELAEIAGTQSEGARMIMLSFANRADAPLTVYQIGKGQLSLNPYTGEEVENKAARVEVFFHELVDIHRWLGAEGKGRAVGKAINGAANLVFLFLVLSGLYLWLPPAWKWILFKAHMIFLREPPTTKARDYNWHHVLGFWAFIPLFFIVLSGVVISYPWAGNLVYAAFGEEAPKRQGPPWMSGGALGGKEGSQDKPDPAGFATLQKAFDTAKREDEGWTKINLIVPPTPETVNVRVLLNNGAGYLPEQRTTHIFDRAQGRIISSETYDDMSAGRKARMFMRFIHTGEQLGLLGSTLAGLASLAACFLVYTGLALSWRRLVSPRLARRRQIDQQP